MAGSLLLPAASERLVELHKALLLAAASLGQREVGAVQRALAVENFEISGDAFSVAGKRQVDRVLQVSYGFFFAKTISMMLLVTDQCVGDIAKTS